MTPQTERNNLPDSNAWFTGQEKIVSKSAACILGFLGAKVDPTEGRVELSGMTVLCPSTQSSLHSASGRNGRFLSLPPVSTAYPRGIPKCNQAWTRNALTISGT